MITNAPIRAPSVLSAQSPSEETRVGCNICNPSMSALSIAPDAAPQSTRARAGRPDWASAIAAPNGAKTATFPAMLISQWMDNPYSAAGRVMDVRSRETVACGRNVIHKSHSAIAPASAHPTLRKRDKLALVQQRFDRVQVRRDDGRRRHGLHRALDVLEAGAGEHHHDALARID